MSAKLKTQIAQLQNINTQLRKQLHQLEGIEIGNHQLELKNCEYMAIISKQNELITKQKYELDRLLEKNNSEVKKANAAIQILERQIHNANQTIRTMQRTAKPKPKKLIEKQFDEMMCGIWRDGPESLHPTYAKTTYKGINGKPKIDMGAFWWRHKKGLQLLCTYSEEFDEVLICDPTIDDEFILPSKTATDKVKSLCKARLKNCA